MLVLSRKQKEGVILADRLTMALIAVIAITETKSSRARIGFHVDKNVNVYRTELTNFAGMSFEELAQIPIGTRVVLKEKS